MKDFQVDWINRDKEEAMLSFGLQTIEGVETSIIIPLRTIYENEFAQREAFTYPFFDGPTIRTFSYMDFLQAVDEADVENYFLYRILPALNILAYCGK